MLDLADQHPACAHTRVSSHTHVDARASHVRALTRSGLDRPVHAQAFMSHTYLCRSVARNGGRGGWGDRGERGTDGLA